MMAEPVFDATDVETVASMTVRLRRLQIKLWRKHQRVSVIVTPQARAVRDRLHAEYQMIAALALALEEGRVDVRPADEDTMALRMANDVEMHFGIFTPPGDEEKPDGA